MTRSLRALAVAAIFVFGGSAASTARAQCLLPDGLDVIPCCTPTSAALPTFPGITDTSKYIGWRDCAAQINQNLCVAFQPPRPVFQAGAVVCGLYTIKMQVMTCPGRVLWTSTLRAHYSRQWVERHPGGQLIGVWRLLLNGDLVPSSFLLSQPPGSNPAVVPTCFGPFHQVFFSGYIDYALDCSTNTWSIAWAINHDCDMIHHGPGSARPAPAAGFHPNRSFTFLGPSVGFVVDPVTPPRANGPVMGESARWNDWASLPAICRTEEALNGTVQALADFCPCSTAPVNAQYTDSLLNAGGSCGTGIVTPPPAAAHLLHKRIGIWTNPVVYPGPEFLVLNFAEILYTNGCTGVTTQERFEGVTSEDGFFALDYAGNALLKKFTDLGSCNKNPGNMARVVGVPYVTQYVIAANTP